MADEDAGSDEVVPRDNAVDDPGLTAVDDPGSPSWALPRGTVVLLTIAGIVVAVLGIK